MSKATSGRRSVLSRTGGVRLLLFAGVLGATVLVATHSTEAAAIASVRVNLRDGRVQSIDHS